MAPEVGVALAGVIYLPVSWLVYEVITHKESIANTKSQLEKMDRKLDRLLDR